MTEAVAAAADSTASTAPAAGSGAASAAVSQAAPVAAASAPANTPAAAGGAAPAYDLKPPEGFDAAAVPKVVEVAKAYGLTPEKAQQLLNDTHARQVQAKADTDAALAKQKAEWHDTIKADKEYGGEKFAASLQRAQKVVGEIDGKIAPGIKQLLDDSGYADHPAVVRLFNYLGAENREDSFAAGGNNAAGSGAQTLTDLLYPKP
jgi:hypothetical protein